MFPEFLKEFQEGLEKYKLDCVKIIATPLNSNEVPGVKQSKFSGIPYLPIGMEYPRDKNNIPMLMLAQINFEEVPALENFPSKGILQFFVSTDWTDIGFDIVRDANMAKVIYHENLEKDFRKDFSFLTEELLNNSPIACEHKLSFIRKTEFGGLGDFRFDFRFNGQGWFDFSEQLNKEQGAEFDNFFSSEGHKIGGYAYFTQDDDREYCENKKDILPILQIDSDNHIVIGDTGVLHFFLDVQELRNKNFEKAYFQWDCC